jgi:murein DD-endopeptidase MepM/ murein hydrolase activator NlpD
VQRVEPEPVKSSSYVAEPDCDKWAVLNGFGVTRYTQPWGEGPPHDGIDILADSGDPVFAIADGEVFLKYRDNVGTTLAVEYAALDITAIYAHVTHSLRDGETVRRGQIIADVVSEPSPWVTHLHFQIRRGRDILDPLSFSYSCRPSDPETPPLFRAAEADTATARPGEALAWPVECRCRRRSDED